MFLEGHCPAGFICFPASTHLIQRVTPHNELLDLFNLNQVRWSRGSSETSWTDTQSSCLFFFYLESNPGTCIVCVHLKIFGVHMVGLM